MVSTYSGNQKVWELQIFTRNCRNPQIHLSFVHPFFLFSPCPPPGISFFPKTLGQKYSRTEISRIFGIFVPDFAQDFAPNFPRNFRGLFVLRLVRDGDQKKFTKNPCHFSMQNSHTNTKKLFTKFLLESRQSNKTPLFLGPPNLLFLVEERQPPGGVVAPQERKGNG